MAADLGFVVHAAQARAHELEAQRARDALAERRLADAGRADEAQDRAAARRVELAHREVLENAALDLREPVVVLVEDLARLRDVDGFRVALRPRQRDEPIEVRAHHRVLRRRVRHALEAPQLLLRLLLDFLGHLRVGDRLAQLVELGLRVVLAELLLDRLQLLAQHVLALALVELALRLLADLARQLQHLDAVREELDDAIEPVANLERLEDRLLLGRLDVDEPATMSASAPGDSMFCSAGASSGGTCGSSSIASMAFCFSSVARASTLASVVTCSGIRSKRAARNGRPLR